MINELQKKYESQFLQISGFSLMTPFGKIILSALDFEFHNLNLFFILYLLFSLVLAFCGMILILHGYVDLGDK